MPDHAASMKKKTLKIQYSLYDSVGLFFKTKTKFGVNTVREIGAK